MSATLDSIVVSNQVHLAAQPPAEQEFDRILVLGPNMSVVGPLVYEDAADILADTATNGLTSSSPEYLAAAAILAQDMKDVAIGKAAISVAQVDNHEIDTYADGTWTLTVDGTDYTYAASGETAEDVVDGLLAALGSNEAVTGTDSGSGFQLTADSKGVGFTSSLTPPGVGAVTSDTLTANVTIVTGFDAVIAATTPSTGWFGVLLVGAGSAVAVADDVERMSAKAETDGAYLFGFQSDASDVKGSGSDDLFSTLETAAYKYSVPFFYSASAAVYFAAAAMGRYLNHDPDIESPQMAHNLLAGIAVDTLTTAERGYVLAKNGNIYLQLGDQGSVYKGTTCSGRWVDELLIALWWKSRTTDRYIALFQRRASLNQRIGNNEEGHRAFDAEARAQYQIAVDAGHAEPESYSSSLPAATTAQKSARSYALTNGFTLRGGIVSVSSTTYLDI